jgi:hypothetical protein
MIRMTTGLLLLLGLCHFPARADIPAPKDVKLDSSRECVLRMQIVDDGAQTRLILPKSLFAPQKPQKKSALPVKPQSLLAFAFLGLGFAAAYSLRNKKSAAAFVLAVTLMIAAMSKSQTSLADSLPAIPRATGEKATIEITRDADATLVISNKALKALFGGPAEK